MRRTAAALLASLGLHSALLVGAVCVPGARALTPNVRLMPVKLEEVRELPLGAPPKARKPRPKSDATRRPPSVKPPDPPKVEEAQEPVPPAVEPGASPADAEVAETKERGDVSAYGPEGSRLVAVLRIDRLRAGPEARPYIAAVDDLLRLLPDRRRLLDQTGLDLYRDFDALLVATPNPLDDTATFLAARHRLGEAALRAALARGAKAGGGDIQWRKQRGRYVGVRKRKSGGAEADRDERLFLLPAPGLLVIASPRYAKLLLDGAAEPDGGGAATEGGAAATDGGAAAAGSDPGEQKGADWSSLVARIDAEDGAIPEDAVFVLTAANLLGPGRIEMARTHGGGAPARRGPAIPERLSILVGTTPTPFLEARAEFEREDDARSTEARWPSWKRDLLANPLVLLARVDPLLLRTVVGRDESTVHLRTSSSSEEMLRLLRMMASFAGGGEAPAGRTGRTGDSR